ncbi:MAG: tetratricopeptide repeat protein [Isosphaeraceae bacterium]
MRKLHVRFLVGFMTVLGLCGGGTYLLHRVQMGRHASSLLDRARSAEAGGNLTMAEESLSLYLGLKREDSAAWAWFARLTDGQTKNPRGRERVFLVNEEALRKNPDDRKLERRCAELAIELERHNDARRHLIHLNDAIQPDPDKAAEAAELEDLLGQCEQPESKFAEAERHYRKSIALDSTRVVTFDRLARLLRQDLKNPAAADRAIEEMLKANPKSALAHVNRWRYHREFGPAADSSDIVLALKLGPDDAEVLIAAAELARQSKDLVGARKHIDRGLDRHPENAGFYQMAAELEMAENHADRAEAVLRRGIAAVPSNVPLKMLLAETLISGNKLDGEEGAIAWIERLRRLGLADGYAQYLDGRVSMAKQRWDGAIKSLESARAVLVADTMITPRINLMLAECYGRVGAEEHRLDALRQLVESDRAPDSARVELARSLARSDKLDQSIAMLLPIVERKPELRLDLVRLLIQKTSRQPRDQRNWQEAEHSLVQAEQALPREIEKLVILRVDLLLAQDRLANALSVLSSAQAKDPRNLQYRLALARLTQRKGESTAALQILEQAAKDLGPNLDLQLARLDYWGLEAGDAAKAAVAKLAETRGQIPDANRPDFLDRLALVEMLRGEPTLARQYWRELVALEPGNLRVLLALFNLSMEAADHADALGLVSSMRKAEGEQGTFWRFAHATLLIDQARRGENKARKASADDLGVLRGLASELAERRPDWWGAPLLQAEIAELEGRDDDVVAAYRRAIDLGNSQPAIVRRLIGVLSDQKRFDDIDRLVTNLRDRGIAAEDLAIATAFNAIRKKDYERGFALARSVIPASSTRYGDHLALGRILMTSRKVEEAGKEFRQAVKLAPSVPETWRSWVEYLARTNQAQAAREAAAAAEKALSPVGSTLTLAQCHWTTGEASKAEALFRAAIKDRPHDAATLRLAASFFLDQNYPDRAAPLVAELFKPETKASQADVAWAKRSEMMLGFAAGVKPEQVEQALRRVEQNLKSDPNDLDAQRMRAVLLSMQFSRRKESIQAIESLDRAQELTPRERFLLVTLYSAEGDWPNCRSEMRKVLEDGRRQPRHLVFYVNLLTRLGELDEAEKWLRALKPLVPGDQTGLVLDLEAKLLRARKQDRELALLIRNYVQQNPDQMRVGAVLFDRFGLLKEAEQAYRADMARNPNETARVLALIDFLARQDRPQEALDLCESAVRTWRPEAVALAGLAIYKAKSVTEPQRRKVEAWLQEMVHQKPDNLVLNTKLADLRTLQGNYPEAEAIYRRSLGANRDNVEALNNLAWQLALREDNPEEALKLVDRALDIAGPNPTLLDTRAVILMQLNQGDKAVEALREAVRSRPDKPTYYFHLARAYQMTKSPSEARKALERSKALGLNEEIIDPLERETYRKLWREVSLR